MKRYRMEQEGKPDVTFEVDFKRLLVFAPDRRFGKSTQATRKACVRGNLAEKLAERTAFYIAQGYQPTEGFTNVREGWVSERGPLEQCEPSLMAYRPKPRRRNSKRHGRWPVKSPFHGSTCTPACRESW